MILIVDDERDLREILIFNLTRAGFETIEAASAEEAGELITAHQGIELILLDVMMGGKSGFEFAAIIRAKGLKIPIIFLTALGEQSDLLKGFAVGGDDYIAKPFSVAEVIARVKAVLARSSVEAAKKITIGDIVIDAEAKSVAVSGRELQLTKTEYGLLYILASKGQKTFSREELLDKVWGSDVFVAHRTVDVHITRLRKKLEGSTVAITSRSGYGYWLSVNDG